MGALAHFGLPTVLTLLDMERRTGVLELHGQDRTGLISLREGQVVRAEVRGAPCRGAEAVFELLGWVEGAFAFRVGEVTDGNEVSVPTAMLLLEAARRADEMAA
jgi:two-component system OmpR family response regulator